jgi:hypothetical protein
MFYEFKKAIDSRRLDWNIRKILDTAPVKIVPAAWTIVSMVGEHDVNMYLLAMKSFYRNLKSGNITAIISKKMNRRERDKIEHHLPGVKTEILEDIDVGPFQRGGTWERLIYIARQSAECYTLQMDCDTLTIGSDINEIIDRIQSNTSYAYSDGNRGIKTLREASEEAGRSDSNYIGLVLERSFASWQKIDTLKYCRASSAITGFAKGSCDLDLLEMFHFTMKQSLGTRWQDWGTEQCASNFMVANSPLVSMLPFPAYSTYPGLGSDMGVKIYHFMGSVRYKNQYYLKKGREIVSTIMMS